MIRTHYFAKIIQKMLLTSFNRCDIDSTARVASYCSLTQVKMGRYSYIGNHTHITGAVIGNFCSIGDDCSIGGGCHPLHMVSTSPVFLQGRNIMGKHFAEIPYSGAEEVRIDHDVWIGDGAYIKAGIKVGTGAVIGAHAVVTRNVEPYTIVAGVPAREIRKRFDDDIIKKLLAIRWWEWSEEKITKYAGLFQDSKRFIEEITKELPVRCK